MGLDLTIPQRLLQLIQKLGEQWCDEVPAGTQLTAHRRQLRQELAERHKLRSWPAGWSVLLRRTRATLSVTKSFDYAFWFLISAAIVAVFIAIFVKPNSIQNSEDDEVNFISENGEREQRA
ncbi:hypothetical protein HBDW_25300 [Herbaspirillum sp. DW155]|uniref:hypothetical protein n=1 Tax=Herbaspirillum sp. DW155 TaxID=3095609 RepID=UPI00308D5EA2|nr:hypothetical protein HBDW_25300 [Herbaspirillum sp. DW155]